MTLTLFYWVWHSHDQDQEPSFLNCSLTFFEIAAELGTSYFASQGHILLSFCFHLERKEKRAQCASTWEGFSSKKKTGLDADEAPCVCYRSETSGRSCLHSVHRTATSGGVAFGASSCWECTLFPSRLSQSDALGEAFPAWPKLFYLQAVGSLTPLGASHWWCWSNLS